jgi:hypothetical protein
VHDPYAWPHVRDPPQGYLKPPPPPGRPHLSRRLRLLVHPQTLAAVAVDCSLSQSFRRREAARELRLEVSNPPVPFVEELVHRGALSDLAGDRTRAAASTGRFAASPPRSPPLPASPLRAPRVGALRAPNRGPEPWIGSRRRAPLPATAVSRRPPPLSRSRASWMLDLDLTLLSKPAAPLRPHASAAVGSRSNGSRSCQPSQARSNPAGSVNFAETPPRFLIFTDIPFRRDKTFMV